MGQRGPLPKRQLRTEDLSSLRAPSYLDDRAKGFWRKHADQLNKNGLLSVQTADSFAVLCDLYSRLRACDGQPTTRVYLDTQKAFSAALKLFRLSPGEKTAEKEDRYEDFNEFEA